MSSQKLRSGTTAWFEMLGALMVEAATRSGLAPELNLSFVEIYTDGVEMGDGLVQGFRFDIIAGRPSFQAGVRPGERGDVTVEITTAAAQRLNSLRSADPSYAAAIDQVLGTGEMRVDGDPPRLGGWLQELHDPIVERTL
jgi:hypothetical protein